MEEFNIHNPLIGSIELIDGYIRNGQLQIDMYTNTITMQLSDYKDLSLNLEGSIDHFLHNLASLVRIWINFERNLKRGESERMNIQIPETLRKIVYTNLENDSPVYFRFLNNPVEKGLSLHMVEIGKEHPIKTIYPNLFESAEAEEEEKDVLQKTSSEVPA